MLKTSVKGTHAVYSKRTMARVVLDVEARASVAPDKGDPEKADLDKADLDKGDLDKGDLDKADLASVAPDKVAPDRAGPVLAGVVREAAEVWRAVVVA